MNEQDNCRWFDLSLNAYLDGELDREARERVNEHARTCPACGQKLETMTRLLTMCAELDEGLSVPLAAQSAWRKAVRAEAQGRVRTRRVGAWTRGMGWIAAALTLLTVSTAMFNRGVTVPPAKISTKMAQAPAGAEFAARDYGVIPGETETGDSMLSLMTDGSMDLNQQVIDDSTAQQAKVVLRSASRSIESTAFDTDSQSVDNLVGEYEGYFESDSQSGQPLEPGGSVGRQRDMAIRVPSAQLDEFLTGLDVIGNVVYKNQTAEDVSSQYYDATARLDALKTQREQINKLMTSATDLTVIADLSDRFYNLQAEIDSLEGRIRGWDSKADFSLVTVSMTEVLARDQMQPVGNTLVDRIRTGFFDSVNWLSAFLQDMAVMLAAAAPVLVVLIPLIVLILVIVKVVRARKRR